MEIDQRLVDAVRTWGQQPAWQTRVLDVLGTKNLASKLWFTSASTDDAVAEAERLVAEAVAQQQAAPADVAEEVRALKLDVKRQREEVAAQTAQTQSKFAKLELEQAQLRARQLHTVTTHATIGKAVTSSAKVCGTDSALFPRKSICLPEFINAKFKKKWQKAEKEADLQKLAPKAMQWIRDSLGRNNGSPGFYHVLDTHKKGFYKSPTAKIDIALSDTRNARWGTHIAPAELKLDINDEAENNTVVGQLAERFTQLREGGQPDRTFMVGLAWGKNDISVWRFGGPDVTTYATTGKLPFEWNSNSPGFQALVGFLDQDLSWYGYTRLQVPPDCTLSSAHGEVQLKEFELLAGTARVKRLVYTAKATGGALGSQETCVVVKVGEKSQIEREFRLLSLRQSEELLPKALACGTLPQPIGDLGWCYASYPLGEHLEEDDTPDLVLSAIAKVALALGRLARVSAERSALLHRDVSPSNIVVYRLPDDSWAPLLLDLHSAKSFSSGGMATVDTNDITGKTLYMSLRLSEQNPEHTLATDLESLFLSLLDIASSGRALRWRHQLKEHVPRQKFTTLYYPAEWEKAIMSCREEFRAALRALHSKIFKDSFSAYLSEPGITPEEFAEALGLMNQ